MQGEQVEQSIIQALDRINATRDNWDVVVIIRGGGATSDLSGFDTYDLAANCAQFPLPIITGIGHERVWRQTVHSSRFLLLPESVMNETIRCWI